MFQSVFHDPVATAAPLSPVVSLGLLESLRPDLLARLLQPYRSELQEDGLSLEHQVLDEGAVRELHRKVNSVDGVIPWRLQQALMRVGDLATPRGHARLLKRVLPALGARTLSMAPEGLAVLSYLDHRAIFDAAHQAYDNDVTGRPYPFAEFVGKTDAPPILDSVGTRAGRGQWHHEQRLDGHAWSPDVRCRIVETSHDVRFYVTRTGPADNCRSVASSWAEPDSSDVVEQHNLAIFDRHSGHLTVDARTDWHQNHLRSLLGGRFWNDEQHFRQQSLYTCEPLQRLGAGAIEHHTLPCVRRAKLIFAQSQAAPNADPQLERPTGRVADDAALWVRLRQAWRVRSFGLLLDLQPLRQSVWVVVRPPHQIGLDRWRSGDVVRHFLQCMGFVQGAQRALEAA